MVLILYSTTCEVDGNSGRNSEGWRHRESADEDETQPKARLSPRHFSETRQK